MATTIDLGAVTAYAQAVANGYTGTIAQWSQLIIDNEVNYQKITADIAALKATFTEENNGLKITIAT